MPKKLYRIQDGKMVAGVCGGLAEYFNIDPTVVRVGWVIFSCLGGAGLIAYIAAAVVMPVKPLSIA